MPTRDQVLQKANQKKRERGEREGLQGKGCNEESIDQNKREHF